MFGQRMKLHCFNYFLENSLYDHPILRVVNYNDIVVPHWASATNYIQLRALQQWSAMSDGTHKPIAKGNLLYILYLPACLHYGIDEYIFIVCTKEAFQCW